ncbi:hypothetical protein [Lactococcus garvieae]|uniref:hypothetical protein n=1 Tax=Lactococcus garvieae TaxID=1363 RepID=UPI00288FBB95|nr:hypothetical protein [Lactococcus garvieae]MDT2741900.1 hypothetical protein [Lactococcus garvieae]
MRQSIMTLSNVAWGKLEKNIYDYQSKDGRSITIMSEFVSFLVIYPEYDYVSFSLNKNFNYTGEAIAYCKSEIVEKFILKRDKEGKVLRQEL